MASVWVDGADGSMSMCFVFWGLEGLWLFTGCAAISYVVHNVHILTIFFNCYCHNLEFFFERSRKLFPSHCGSTVLQKVVSCSAGLCQPSRASRKCTTEAT